MFALSNAPVGVVYGTTHAQTITIVNNDLGGVISFAATNFISAQGSNALINIRRTGGLGNGVNVHFEMSGGTAVPGIDYVNFSQNFTFNAGETNHAITIGLPFNVASTNGSFVNLSLSNPTSGATIGAVSNATLTIRHRTDPGNIPEAGAVFFSAAVDGVTVTNLILVTTNYTAGVFGFNSVVQLSAQQSINPGTSSSQLTEFAFEDLVANSVGVLNFADSSTANGQFSYNVTQGFFGTQFSYTGVPGTGGSVSIDALNITTKTIAGRFNLVVKNSVSLTSHTVVGSFRARW